ncbi:MAG: hypothetical protein KAH91_01395, partial [Thermoplasmatales archaeon]|nr:hypothetical protein [Thermoplasmatales archaeon]
TYKIKQFQIIQHKIDTMEIMVIIDENLRDEGASVKDIFDEIENRFKKIVGSEVNIIINEVKEIPKDEGINFVKVVVSKIKDY